MAREDDRDVAADLRVAPTTLGMVRIHVTADDGTDLPMDFDPDEAEAIAEELRAAAEAARSVTEGRKGR